MAQLQTTMSENLPPAKRLKADEKVPAEEGGGGKKDEAEIRRDNGAAETTTVDGSSANVQSASGAIT